MADTTDTDYSFMEVDLDSAKELATLPAGTEARVCVNEVFTDPIRRNVRLRMDIVDEELTKSFSHFIYFPKEEDDDKKKNNKLLMLKRFYKCFDIPDTCRDPREYVGHEGCVILGEESSERYGMQNNIDRLVTPAS